MSSTPFNTSVPTGEDCEFEKHFKELSDPLQSLFIVWQHINYISETLTEKTAFLDVAFEELITKAESSIKTIEQLTLLPEIPDTLYSASIVSLPLPEDRCTPERLRSTLAEFNKLIAIVNRTQLGPEPS